LIGGRFPLAEATGTSGLAERYAAALFELALVLLVLGLILNIAARTLVYSATQRRFDRAK